MARPGLTSVANVPRHSPPRTFVAPISVIMSSARSLPVVSMSSTQNVTSHSGVPRSSRLRCPVRRCARSVNASTNARSCQERAFDHAVSTVAPWTRGDRRRSRRRARRGAALGAGARRRRGRGGRQGASAVGVPRRAASAAAPEAAHCGAARPGRGGPSRTMPRSAPTSPTWPPPTWSTRSGWCGCADHPVGSSGSTSWSTGRRRPTPRRRLGASSAAVPRRRRLPSASVPSTPSPATRWVREHERRVGLQARLAEAERERDDAIGSASQARADADRLLAELATARADVTVAPPRGHRSARAGGRSGGGARRGARGARRRAARAPGCPLAPGRPRGRPPGAGRRGRGARPGAGGGPRAWRGRSPTPRSAPAVAWPPPGAAVRPSARRRVPGGRPCRSPAGCTPGSAAVTEHLLRLPGIVVLVDGYNVAKLGWPALALDVQRERLVTTAEDVARRWGTDVTVVFDGADVPGASAPRRRLVRVVFSPAGVSADDVLRAEVGHARPSPRRGRRDQRPGGGRRRARGGRQHRGQRPVPRRRPALRPRAGTSSHPCATVAVGGDPNRRTRRTSPCTASMPRHPPSPSRATRA